MSVWSEVMLKYQVVCHGCKKQGREFQMMNSRHLKQFAWWPFALNLQSVTLELHRMSLLHTKPIKHLQIRGQWRSWIVSAGSQTQWASSFAGTAVHAVPPSHLLSQVSHTPVTPDHSWWQFDVPHCRSTRLQQSKPFICRSYGRIMYPVTCTKHVKRNTDSPTNNIPVTHDSVYTTISCSPNLLFPLKRRITAWIASLTDFLYLQPIVTW